MKPAIVLLSLGVIIWVIPFRADADSPKSTADSTQSTRNNQNNTVLPPENINSGSSPGNDGSISKEPECSQ